MNFSHTVHENTIKRGRQPVWGATLGRLGPKTAQILNIHTMKYMTAAQAVQLIESGDSIYIQGSTSVPEVLSQALAD